MPRNTRIWNLAVNETSGATIVARVEDASASLILQAGFGTITANLKPKDPAGDIVQVSLTVADCVFDTLQTDGFWKDNNGVLYDTLGYNFRWQFGVDIFPRPGVWGLTIRFAPTSGAAFDGIEALVNVAKAQGR